MVMENTGNDTEADTAKKPEPDIEGTISVKDQPQSRRVLVISIAIASLLVFSAILVPQRLHAVVELLSNNLIRLTGWYYVLIIFIVVCFLFVVALSRRGDIMLGREDDEPAYSLRSWFAMLFAAGMGIGLVFFGASEPLQHFINPSPDVGPEVGERARSAMASTFLHWGLSAWAIYAIVGLAVAYAVHRRGLPVSVRWTISSLLGKRTRGGIGDAIDIVAVIGTLIGVATSLGFGIMQFSSGIEFLTGVQLPKPAILSIAGVITMLAAISVTLGLDRGIKNLSNANLVLAAVFLVLVLVLGPTLFIFNEFVQDVGYYLQNFVSLSLRTLPFEGAAGMDWMHSWTIYYWGWWMSWSPFVGVFIARISKGRTVREFILGTVLVPTLVTFLWFAVMGGTALFQQIYGDTSLLVEGNLVDNTMTLFLMLANLPAGKLLSGIAMVLLVIFFVTSADSASFVMSILSTNGDPDVKAPIRLAWALFTGAVTIALLASGGSTFDGISALQTLVITSAAPLSVVIALMAIALWRNLSRESDAIRSRRNERLRSQLVDDTARQVASSTNRDASTIGLPTSHWSPSSGRVPVKKQE